MVRRFELCGLQVSCRCHFSGVPGFTYESGEVLALERGRSIDAVFSTEPGEPLLLALFAAGSEVFAADAALSCECEGAIAANERGEV